MTMTDAGFKNNVLKASNYSRKGMEDLRLGFNLIGTKYNADAIQHFVDAKAALLDAVRIWNLIDYYHTAARDRARSEFAYQGYKLANEMNVHMEEFDLESI